MAAERNVVSPMWRRLEKSCRMLALGLGLLASPFPVHANNNAAEIKTAFIYNFAKFVEWPGSAFAEPDSPLQLCVWEATLEGRLHLLNGREAQGRKIRVRRLETPDSLPGCHILVVGSMNDSLRTQLLQAIGRGNVLTIGDSGDFIHQGGMIGLFVEANRVQFSVNLKAAQTAGLKMSARLLQLARNLRGGTP